MSTVPGGFQPYLAEGVDAGPRWLFGLRYIGGRGSWSTAPGGLHPWRLSRPDEAVLGGDGILDAGDAFAFAFGVAIFLSGDGGLDEVVRSLGSLVGVAIWGVVLERICG